MARHRSPLGRRAHLGPPLSAVVAAAGVGGAHRPISLRQPTPCFSIRLIATAVAGGALVAAGQHVLVDAAPVTADGANVLLLGVDEILNATFAPEPAAVAGPGGVVRPAELVAAQPLAAQPRAAVAPVVPEPAVAGVAELVKAADLQRRTVETAPRPAEAEPARAVATATGGAVQMIVGRVTSGFGARWGSRHQGLDIAAPIGTPIRVPLDGTVIDSGPAGGFGLWVRVEHADGTVTVYGHVNRALVGVGEKVTAGEVIAEVGNRGRSTGPHLHIEVVTPGGQKINPRPWLDERGIGYRLG